MQYRYISIQYRYKNIQEVPVCYLRESILEDGAVLLRNDDILFFASLFTRVSEGQVHLETNWNHAKLIITPKNAELFL
jgi:hypothetical protein